ncbi:secondary thiamine-phosphate synthase enzyme [Methanocalculus chunghsingensis]|uniref:Secondary thiamine-phosphate synthase enzyme n=1 Tax=Methanocalculus chunghsingensis TaxID=156457 RepID=A0A8J7WBH8_9EURY|nr:secondary thiamine-phosphate synthase enzyme YjbQ [Methanocalculus chunghsingensis]MBR1369887.1 secondary thiamine-phosphate synthase enzyme [Methanocalculus chunghsingensis]
MYQTRIQIRTSGEGDIIDITSALSDAVRTSGIQTGVLHLFVIGSTAALTTIEYDPGALADLREALDRVAPSGAPYAHDARWGDGNGRSHVRAAILGPSISIPVAEGKLLLGTWQQAILVELDIRQSRERMIVLTILP